MMVIADKISNDVIICHHCTVVNTQVVVDKM